MGRRITSPAARREARIAVTIAGHVWRVCESCTDLLVRDMRAEGYGPVEKYVLEPAPASQQRGSYRRHLRPTRRKRRAKKGGQTEKQARRALEKAKRQFSPPRSFEDIVADVRAKLNAARKRRSR